MKYLILSLVLLTACSGRHEPQIFSLDQFKTCNYSQDYFLLVFSAPWCISCKTEINSLTKFQSKFASKLKVLAITDTTEIEMLNKWQAELPANIQIILDSNRIYYEKYKVINLPSFVLLNKAGEDLPLVDPETSELTKELSGAKDWLNPAIIEYFRQLP